MKWIKRIVLLGIVAAIGGTLYYFLVIRRPNPNLKNATPDFSVTMSNLLGEISKNDSAAKLKYTDKIVQVTGTVKEVLINDSTATINLGDSTSPSLIQCQIDSRNKDNISIAKQNMPITIKGKLAAIKNQNADPSLGDMGIDLGTDIVLNFCAIVK